MMTEWAVPTLKDHGSSIQRGSSREDRVRSVEENVHDRRTLNLAARKAVGSEKG